MTKPIIYAIIIGLVKIRILEGIVVLPWILFFIQVVLITISAYGQIPATIHSNGGVNISWFGFWLFFSIINAVLCRRAWQQTKEMKLLLLTLVHCIWAMVAAANLIASIVCGNYRIDSLIIGLVALGCAVTYGIARFKYNVGMTDPIVKGMFSLLCRVIPQLTLCFYMLHGGATTVSVQIIVTGHCTIALRLVQLFGDLKKSREARASFIADAANEASWIIATVVWASI